MSDQADAVVARYTAHAHRARQWRIDRDAANRARGQSSRQPRSVALWSDCRYAAANPAHSRVHPHPCPSRAAGTCIGRALNGAITPYLEQLHRSVGGRPDRGRCSPALARNGRPRRPGSGSGPGASRSPSAFATKCGAATGGTCIECGSRERLEFDHIVPVSRGGSNTARNLELRCEPCNRRKGDRI